MLRKTYILLILSVLVFSLPLVAVAQEGDYEVIADGLNSPRQLYYTDDGTLYIAEAGVGGAGQVVVDPETTVSAGLTGQILAVSPDGERTVAVPALPSTQISPNSTGWRGSQGILVTDDTYWVAIGEAVQPALKVFPLFVNVLGIDRETMRIRHLVDTLAAEMEQNADGGAIFSDPTDFAMAEDGTLYIADAGCNCLWTWTEADGLQLLTSWTNDDNPVPTSIDIASDSSLYVGTLSGFPFPEGGARIEHVSTDGEQLESFDGFTLVTDVLVEDTDNIYVVELASGFGDAGYIPDSGRILKVSADSMDEPETIAEGLPYPYGIALTPDGSSLAVSVNTAFATEQGTGSVVRVPLSE